MWLGGSREDLSKSVHWQHFTYRRKKVKLGSNILKKIFFLVHFNRLLKNIQHEIFSKDVFE